MEKTEFKILFVSNTCSEKKYNEVYKGRTKSYLDPSQKFFRLLLDGFKKYDDCKIDALSYVPVSFGTHKKKLWQREEEMIHKGLIYHYIPLINLPLLRNLTIWVCFLIYSLRWCSNNKKSNAIIVCDPLAYDAASATMLAARLFGIKVAGIVTDLPKLTSNITEEQVSILRRILQSVYDRLSENHMQHYDAYVFLTESMNNVVNIKDKPYVIMECIADTGMIKKVNNIKQKYEKKCVLYAGKLHRKFGLDLLIEAAKLVKTQDFELHVYGEGDYQNKIIEATAQNSSIHYFGVVPVAKIVEEEMRATLLINPRPTINDFTKYSFPSKTAEYMASGTLVLTTRLDGIPHDYDSYLEYFNEETPEAMAKKIDEILALPKIVLHRKGESAKQFILKNKNNIASAKKLVDFFLKLINV